MEISRISRYQYILFVSALIWITCILLSSPFQVTWRQSRIVFSQRFNKYLDPNFFQHRVRVYTVLCFCEFKYHVVKCCGSLYMMKNC